MLFLRDEAPCTVGTAQRTRLMAKMRNRRPHYLNSICGVTHSHRLQLTRRKVLIPAELSWLS